MKKYFIVFLGLTLLFFYKCIFFGQALIASDILTYIYPWKLLGIYPLYSHNPSLGDSIVDYYPLLQFSTELIKNGILPFWNPYLYLGTPLLALNEAFSLSPVSILAYFLPLYKAITYYIIVTIFFAGVFMYIYLRKGLGLSGFSSFIGGLVFMFNGHFIVWLEHIGFVSVLLWLPLILLFIEKMIQRKSLVYAILAGIIMGIQFFGGSLQVSSYLILGVLIYSLIRIFQEYLKEKDNRMSIKFLSSLFLIFLIGLGIGAIQLFPSLELLKLSDRLIAPNQFKIINPACFFALFSFIIPDIFGNPIHYNYWGPENYVELCGYIGILPLILAALAVVKRRDKWVFVFSAIALFSLSVYLYTPIKNLLSLLFPYNARLSVVRIICLYAFSGSVLSAIGADYLNSNQRSVKKIRKVLIICFFTVLLFYLLGNFLIQTNKDYIIEKGRHINYTPWWQDEFVANPEFYILSLFFLKAFGNEYAKYIRYYSPFSPAVYMPLSLLIMSIILFGRYKKVFFKFFLTLIIIIDLFYFGMRFNTTSNPMTIYPKLKSVEFLKKDKTPYRVLYEENKDTFTFVPNTLMAYHIQSLNGYLSLFPKRYDEFWRLIGKKIEGGSYILTDYHSKLLDLLNVKYFVGVQSGQADKEFKDTKFKLVYSEGPMRIYENKSCMARAFFVSGFKVIKTQKDILCKLVDTNFEPDKEVILEENPPIKAERVRSDGISSLTIINYSAGEVEIDINAPDNGFLILSDTYYPGWKVFVDGKIDKIFRADYILRAVFLAKGRHAVKFIYDPLSFKFGVFTASITLAAALLLISIIKWKSLRL